MVLVTVLGSCVSACIRDRIAGVGGMNHFMLPKAGGVGTRAASDRRATAAYAMEVLINAAAQGRARRRERLEAKVFGGGAVLRGLTQLNIGERNADFVLQYLRNEDMPVRGGGPARHAAARASATSPAVRPGRW